MPLDNTVIRIPLNRGKIALIDAADAVAVLHIKWFAKPAPNTYYVRGWDPNTQREVSLHRFLLGTPRGLVTDHKNGNGLDNRRHNLRAVTQGQNVRNRHTKIKNSTGYIGVYFDESTGKWNAALRVEGKLIRHYGFRSAHDAATAHDYLAHKHGSGFYQLNFPRSVVTTLPPRDTAIHKGRPGLAPGNAKLNAEIVAEIRSLQGKMTHVEMAKRFGVSRSSIRNVLKFRTWS